jgi:hypothetical protein
MPRFQFSLGNDDAVREAGAVLSDSFDDALTAISEQAAVKEGDTLEIGVQGFPPARYQYVSLGRGAQAWRPANLMAA